jgi:hypothetical protein
MPPTSEGLPSEKPLERFLNPNVPPPTPPAHEPIPETIGVGEERSDGSIQESVKNKRRPILRSYVPSPNESDPESPTESHDEESLGRDPTDEGGVHRVLEYEIACGRVPKEMPHWNPGYDVESRDAAGNIVRYIEVKSLSGYWKNTYAVLSRPQFEKALALGDIFWLYVVERAQSDDFRIHRIQNPALKANHFMFDDGWRATAELPSS